MSLLGQILAAKKSDGLHPSDPAVAEWFAATAAETAAGVRVTPESALRISAVYACISLIAETIGSLPSGMLAEDGPFRRKVTDHPLERTLTERANPELDAGEFWEQMVGWMLCRGNGLAWIDTETRGEINLWPIPWNRVRVARTSSGRLAYLVTLGQADNAGSIETGQQVALLSDEVLHYRNFGLGPIGLSPIAQAAESIGLSEAAQEYGARLFSQDARPGGYLRVPGNLDDDDWKKLHTRWRQLHEGAKRAHMVGILEGGAEWQKVGINPEEAQFLELRKFQVTDIARYFRVFPWLINDVEKTSSWGSGVEVQGIGFVTYTLRTRLTRLERVTRMRLLAREPDTFHRFNVAGLLRGDLKSRYQSYAVGRQWGFLSINDIRSLEDMAPVVNGDTYLTPRNMESVARHPDSTGHVDDVDPQVLAELKELAGVTGLAESDGDGRTP